ncbi:MAG: DUF433 domain-containing protein [Chloroherpetonaceae bacterium]
MLTLFDSITINSEVCNGQPTIRGTRITVQTIMEFLGAGESIDEILRQYPSLTREDISACLRFTAELMKNRFVIHHR